VLSQMGRPDDGTDVSTFNNAEFLADLKPSGQWRPQFHGNKEELIAAIQSDFKRFPGIDFNFSQYIQDNVEEGLSGVKGANSIKIIGPDLTTLERIAGDVMKQMEQVPGVTDLGIFRVLGQPNLNITVDRPKAARYGLNTGDINSVIQAALAGKGDELLPGVLAHVCHNQIISRRQRATARARRPPGGYSARPPGLRPWAARNRPS